MRDVDRPAVAVDRIGLADIRAGGSRRQLARKASVPQMAGAGVCHAKRHPEWSPDLSRPAIDPPTHRLAGAK